MDNIYYSPSQGSERDFVLCVLAAGARIGYDAGGTTWAIVNEYEAQSLGEIIYQDTPRIGEVALPDGDVAEWVDGGIEFARTKPEPASSFWLKGLENCVPALLYAQEGWCIDRHTPEGEREWFPTPTIPADRIEQMAREAAMPVAA